MCIQNCVKGILSMSLNPQYQSLGDDLHTPDIITSIMTQAERGEIPVLGAGYRGPFSGEGFDSMWTDMSEIVRPTRDGIHGREYISTVVDLGRKPLDVKNIHFDENGNPLTNIPATLEIKLPIVIDHLPFSPGGDNIQLAQAKAAVNLGTFCIIEKELYSERLAPFANHIIQHITPEDMQWRKLVEVAKTCSAIELNYSPEVGGLAGSLKKINPDLIIFVRINRFENLETVILDLCNSGIDVMHLHVEHYHAPNPGSRAGTETASEKSHPDFEDQETGISPSKKCTLPEIIRSVHNRLVELQIRDSMTIVASGEIACADHVPKAIILGADAVAIDLPTLIALECTVCQECVGGRRCPRNLEAIDPEWGSRRIMNIIASWHSQLLEVLGAMGLREVSRLRGEIGRAMFKEELDEEILYGTIERDNAS
jgi:hypothetical protein